MAIHTLGTATTSSLQCTPGWSAVVAEADGAAVGGAILNDGGIAKILSGWSAGETFILATGTTHSNTTLDTLVARAGSPPLTQILVGDIVRGIGIPVGTYVVAKPSGTSVTLSQAATAGAAGVGIVFARPVRPYFDVATGLLHIPNRGQIRVLPGDVVAVDNSGWPIVVSGNSIAYAASQWTFT